MKWNDDWRTELKLNDESCYIRLCECRNTKHDIELMASLMYKYNLDKTAEDCLMRMFEWVGDWNNQWELVDNISNEEFKRMLKKVLTYNY